MEEVDTGRGPAGYPLGVRLGTVPPDAAGVVRIWFRGQRLDQGPSRQRHATVASDGLRMALFSDTALEYGHGAGQERYRDRCTLQGTGRRCRTARSDILPPARRVREF